MAEDGPSQGILCIAFGTSYQEEARRLLRSLKKVSTVPTAVVTDTPWLTEPFPDQFIIREPLSSFRAKPLFMYEASPFQNTLFLDTDIIVARDIAPIFGLLKYYDIGLRFGGPQLNEGDGLDYHTQCNSGVILFSKGKEVENVMGRWMQLYDDAANNIASDDFRGLNDQRYLAIAIARSRARPVHLAEYLNFTLFDNIVTCSPPVVYHGRKPWMESFARNVNRSWNQKNDWWARVWSPNISGFLPRGIRRSDPLLGSALLLRKVYNELKWRLMY